MSADSIRAAEIYAQVAKAAENAPKANEAGDVAKPDFSQMLQSALETTTASLETGEAAAASVAAGNASLVDVVTAVSAAEVSLETAIAVRNRIIESYQEILRMPI